MRRTSAIVLLTAGVITSTAMPASAALSPGFSDRQVDTDGIALVSTIVNLPPPPATPPGVPIPYPNFGKVID